MNEYVRYMNMRYEMAECAEVTRQVLGLTVPVSLETLMEAMKKAGIQCVPDESLNTDTRIVELPENPEYAFQQVRNLLLLYLRFPQVLLSYQKEPLHLMMESKSTRMVCPLSLLTMKH